MQNGKSLLHFHDVASSTKSKNLASLKNHFFLFYYIVDKPEKVFRISYFVRSDCFFGFCLNSNLKLET